MIKKPKIIPFPRIGKEKYKDAFERTKDFNKKEQAYLSLSTKKSPKKNVDLKRIQVGEKRREKSVSIDLETINFLLKIAKNKNNSLVHTHIVTRKSGKDNRYTALPSLKDINTIFSLPSNIKYKLIVSINSKGERLGYTILKLDKRKKIYYSQFKEAIKNFEIDILLSKKELTRKEYIYFLEKMGIEIYFTPMPGCKLSRNYNFLKKLN
jgi:hypothetical protein